MDEIQTLLFDKNYYTKTQVNQWLRRHNITPIKQIHITKNFYRSRLKTRIIINIVIGLEI